MNQSMRAAWRTVPWRRKRLRVPNSLPFHNRKDRVGGDIFQFFHFAVIIDIAESGAPASGKRNRHKPGRGGDVLKCAVMQVAEQLHWLTILHTAGDRIHLRVYVPVGDEDIQPAGVAEVHKSGSPL